MQAAEDAAAERVLVVGELGVRRCVGFELNRQFVKLGVHIVGVVNEQGFWSARRNRRTPLGNSLVRNDDVFQPENGFGIDVGYHGRLVQHDVPTDEDVTDQAASRSVFPAFRSEFEFFRFADVVQDRSRDDERLLQWRLHSCVVVAVFVGKKHRRPRDGKCVLQIAAHERVMVSRCSRVRLDEVCALGQQFNH